ncbi:MAG: c-type cytochrome domain-containing protein [Pirellulales bacterium]
MPLRLGQHLPRRLVVVAVCLAAVVSLPAVAGAASSPKEIRERIDAASKLLVAGKGDEAVAALAEGIAGLEAMAAAPKPVAGFKTLVDRAEGVRKKLEKAGVDVSRLSIPAVATPAEAAGPQKPVVGAGNAISFSRQVAPILSRSCGGCHVTGRKGDFQMATYDGLMKTGYVQRGAGQASRLVEVILTGDMPRGGGKVSSDDVATLVKWIDAGAACDADPMLGIDVLARGGGAPPPPVRAVAVRAVTIKPGEVSFACDVAPLLARHCLGCHGGNETEARLSLASMDALLKGGRTGEAVVAGKGSESLLVKKLRGAGIEGQRMPLNKPPLPDAEIALIERWITEGARLDMLTGATPLETVVSAGMTKKLTDAELSTIRHAAGEKLWRRAIPEEAPTVVSRPGVCLIGNLPDQRMTELADVAADVAGRVRAELVDEGPVVKGGVVLYVVRQAFDYSALWQTIVGGERPKGITANAGVSGEVVYGAMLVPSTDDPGDLEAAFAESFASAAFASRNVPGWFSRGAGRAVATRIAPKSGTVLAWKRDASAAVSKLGSPADFFAGHADPAASTLAAGGFVGSLATGDRLAQTIALLDAGSAFDDAFAKAFKATPAQALQKWASRSAR